MTKITDLILSSYLTNFTDGFGISVTDTPTQFEHFVNYCVVAREYQCTFDVEDISTGNAMGIDGIAIFVNDSLITSPTEVSGVARQRLDARFIFTQAKTSTSIDLGEFLKFLVAVEHFFGTADKDEEHPLANWLAIKQEIYNRAITFDENPLLSLTFCYPGTQQENDLLSQQINAFISRLKATSLFRNVEVSVFDAEKLKSIYRGLSNKVTKQISFEKHTILPKIPGVKRSFIGILPCKDYLRLISDDEGKLARNVFYDNVRDFQGENSVNREIMETLKGDNEGGQIFVLLNNGVTIVAKSINPVGTDFTIRDFQVVNGCQTSHILYNNKEILSGNEFITIKLIETDDVELTNKITKATNRQTEVKLEAFAGLQQFHKELEAFFESFPIPERLYYERRSGQYDGVNSVIHNRIISIPNQIKSFVSIFLEEPHQIHFYYGKLLEDYSTGEGSVLFNEGHDTYPYYIASWLAFRLNDALKKPGKQHLKRWRYHLAMMVRTILGGPFSKGRLTDSNYCKNYCGRIIRSLEENNALPTALNQAEAILDAAIKKTNKHERNLTQNNEFSKSLILDCIKASQSKTQTAADGIEIPKFDGFYVGNIKSIVPEKKFGFIQYGQRQFYFRYIKETFVTEQQVRFKLKASRNAGESEAYDVILV